MKTMTAIVLAATFSAGAAFASDPTQAAQFRSMNDKAATDYKAAVANCAGMSGNTRVICVDEAKLARARTEAEAVAAYNDTIKLRTNARIKVADAELALSRDKCADQAATDKTTCIDNAKSVHKVAVADAKADRITATAANTGKTEDVRTLGEKTRDVAANAADKTGAAIDTAVAKSGQAAAKTGDVVSDSVITTKVKADIFREPELKSMAIHVETENGVVMLSGFVQSKADAEKAARIAGTVKGVTQVKSSLQVK